MADFREMTGCFECVSRPWRGRRPWHFIFAELADGDLRLTDAGRRFVDLDPDDRKRLFAQHLLVSLAGHIRRVLDERPAHRAPASRFRDELEDHMSEQFADQTLRSVTSWGRYAESFAYDEATGVFSLDNPS